MTEELAKKIYDYRSERGFDAALNGLTEYAEACRILDLPATYKRNFINAFYGDTK